jgi:MarR family transcriptional regulator, organic hydroperoxide resistance regulator
LEFEISEIKTTWELVLDLHRLVAEHLSTVAAELDLKPGQAQALQQLEPGREKTMGELAKGIRCDPSTITGIADRLVARGLAERGSAAGDRRVKTLRLTAEGEDLRGKLLRRLADVPPELANLPSAREKALRKLLHETLEPR